MQPFLGELSQLNINSSVAVARLIRGAIIEGNLDPGQRLKAGDLARALGVSRTPVREALLILQIEGLIDAPTNKGASVHAFSDEEIDDLYRTRALLEERAANLAAERASGDQIRALIESCDRFRRLRAADEVQELIRENQTFHALVLEASGSSAIERTLSVVAILPLRYRSYWWYSNSQKRVTEQHHLQIARAIQQHDQATAAIAMREHIFSAADFRRSLQEPKSEPFTSLESHSQREAP